MIHSLENTGISTRYQHNLKIACQHCRNAAQWLHDLLVVSCGFKSQKSQWCMVTGTASNLKSLLSSHKVSLSTREQTQQLCIRVYNVEIAPRPRTSYIGSINSTKL